MDRTGNGAIFYMDTDCIHLTQDESDYFEKQVGAKGFRTEKDVQGVYISELTQVALFAFSVGLRFGKQDGKPVPEVSIASDLAETVQPDVNTGIVVSPPAPKPESPVVHTRASQTTYNSFAQLLEQEEAYDKHDNTSNACSGRTFNKSLYSSKSQAVRRASMVSRSQAIPMWVHPATDQNGWHISSHGFDIARRPDALVSLCELDKKQLESGFIPSDMAEEIKPSIVTRIADNGRVYTQNGQFFSPNVLLEWMREQEDPAIVISFGNREREKRAARIAELQESITAFLGFTSYFRWITPNTIALAVSHDRLDYSPARERVQNPYWFIKAITWPNSFILKEKG